MSALCQQQTSAKYPFLILERKKKDRLAAVSPKSDPVFLSGRCDNNSVLPHPAPSKKTHRA